jgi:hypothetical protein
MTDNEQWWPICLKAAAGRGAAILLALLVGGCGPPWVYSYVEAEKLGKAAERPILVFYRDHLDPQCGQMLKTLNTTATRVTNHRNMVRCSLLTAYNPDRRYVAQYGVTSAPALIVIHPDGTYHSRMGSGTAEEVMEFLENATPPGSTPNLDIQVVRPTDYLARAEGTYEKALGKARRQNRKLLIIYKWWLDGDSTEMIRRMMRPEVAARCSETINCILDWDYVPNRRHVGQHGVSRYPALIIVHQDGRADVREGLMPTEEIVRFLTQVLRPDGSAAD